MKTENIMTYQQVVEELYDIVFKGKRINAPYIPAMFTPPLSNISVELQNKLRKPDEK